MFGASPRTVMLSALVEACPTARAESRASDEGAPNSVTVGGGTPRRVHSRPNAAMAPGWARKKLGSFHTLVSSSSRSSGVGGPFRVRMRCVGAALARSPYSPLLMSSPSCFSSFSR